MSGLTVSERVPCFGGLPYTGEFLIGLATTGIVIAPEENREYYPHLDFLEIFMREGRVHISLSIYSTDKLPKSNWMPYSSNQDLVRIQTRNFKTHLYKEIVAEDVPAFTATNPEFYIVTDRTLIFIMPEKLKLPRGWRTADREEHFQFSELEREKKLKEIPYNHNDEEKQAESRISRVNTPPEIKEFKPVEISCTERLPDDTPLTFTLPELVRHLNLARRKDPSLVFKLDEVHNTLEVHKTEIIK